jgi:hypothetical protein
MPEEQQERGIAELTTRLNRAGLNLLERSRPWSHLRVTYFELAKSDRVSDVVVSDDFIRDLPNTREYQEATDAYAAAVAGRIRCGSPNLFYGISHLAIEITVKWPIQAAVVRGMPQHGS